jgi:hypothetical protein
VATSNANGHLPGERKSIEPIPAYLAPENVHPMSVPTPHDGKGAGE